MFALLEGRYELVSRDADGRVLGTIAFDNGPTDEGVNYLGNAGFRGGPKVSVWYVGLIDGNGYVSLNVADTHSSHPGWTEFVNVASGLRKTWAPAALNGGFIDSPNLTFSITAGGTIRGAFLASQQATGSSSGPVIYATAVADAGVPVVAAGTLTFSYKLRFTPNPGE